MIAVSRRACRSGKRKSSHRAPIHSTLPTRQVGHLDRVAAHLAEGDAEVGLLPGPPHRPLRQAAPIGVRDLFGGEVDQAVARRSEPHVAGDVLDAPAVVEAVIDVGGLDDGHVGASELVQASGQVGEQLGVGRVRAILAVIGEHEGRLDGHPQRPGRSAEGPLAVAEPPLQARVVQQAAEEGPLGLGRFPRDDPDPPAGAERVRGQGRSPVAGEEVFADLADPPGHLVGRHPRHESVLLVERLGQDGEDMDVPVLVVADAPEVVDQRRGELGHLDGQFQHAFVAEPGGQLGVDVEQAEVAEGAVAEVLADVAGDLPGEAPHPDDHRGQESGRGGLAPADVLPHGAGPAPHGAGHLAQVRPGLQRPAPQAEDRAPEVDGVHLLVLPGPGQGVRDQLAELRADRHPREPSGDHRLAVADRDDLLAFQGQEQQVDHLAAGTPGLPAPQDGQLDLELLVDGSHRPLRAGHGSTSTSRRDAGHRPLSKGPIDGTSRSVPGQLSRNDSRFLLHPSTRTSPGRARR